MKYVLVICVLFYCHHLNVNCSAVTVTRNAAEEGTRSEEAEPRDESTNMVTAVDLLQNIYKECVQDGSFSCVKLKVLAYLNSSIGKDKIRITRDLTIVRSDSSTQNEMSTLNELKKISELDEKKKESLKLMALDKLDEFLSNHELRIRMPKEILTGNVPPFVPPILMKNLPSEIKLPLTGTSDDQFSGRSKKLLKRVVMPFLLGLKFKATTIVPLAFALIALKTWKAFTLGLLSLVLSAAMVIYKFTKPKVSYEVIHYPQPVAVYPDHSHHEKHPYARQLDSPHQLAYRAYVDPTSD